MRKQKIELRIHPDDPTDIWVYHGRERLVRVEPFSPPHKLPPLPERDGGAASRPQTALESSRAYLGNLTAEHSRRCEKLIDPAAATPPPRDILTLDDVLRALELPGRALTPDEHRAVHGLFDTFGPFDRPPAMATLQEAIERFGRRRHLTVYLKAIVEAQFRSHGGGEKR